MHSQVIIKKAQLQVLIPKEAVFFLSLKLFRSDGICCYRQ